MAVQGVWSAQCRTSSNHVRRQKDKLFGKNELFRRIGAMERDSKMRDTGTDRSELPKPGDFGCEP
jgi:hypothetical protein